MDRLSIRQDGDPRFPIGYYPSHDATHIKVHDPPGGQDGQALGRTKGRMNTRLHAVVDETGQPAALFLSPGND